jgi:hypothetical protein
VIRCHKCHRGVDVEDDDARDLNRVGAVGVGENDFAPMVDAVEGKNVTWNGKVACSGKAGPPTYSSSPTMASPHASSARRGPTAISLL